MKATSLDHLAVSSPEFEGDITSLPKSEQRALRKAYWLTPKAGRIVIEQLLCDYYNAHVKNNAESSGISIEIIKRWHLPAGSSGNRYIVVFNSNTPGPQLIEAQDRDYPELSRIVRFTYDGDGRLSRVQEYDLSSVLKREVLVVYDDSDGACVGEGVVSTRHENPRIRKWYGPDGLKFAYENLETCEVTPWSNPTGYKRAKDRVNNTPVGVLMHHIGAIF